MAVVLLIGLVLVGLSVALALQAMGATQARRRQRLAQIGAYGFHASAPVGREQPSLRELLGRLATALGAIGSRLVQGKRLEELRGLLRAAGLYRTTVGTFVGYRLLLTLVLPALWLWLATAGGGSATLAVVGVACFGGLGWVTPMFLLRRKVRQRLEAIDREVPELVDLLVTTVEAGVGFTAALQLAARRVEGPLGQELRVALREQSMGLTINEALRNMLARTDSPYVRAFVQAIVQGETLGVSIGKILRDLAIDMRKRRRQAAEERAHKAPTKILFPLVALIFPALFVVSLGPLVISFLHALG